jgi:glutamine amidotransferase
MIQVIDYKAGNLTSVVKALTYLGAETHVTQSPADIRNATKIVLPGVGHFRATSLLGNLGITEAVREAIGSGANFLGVCVGLQWLFEGSTEAPETPGLAHFAGRCEHFPEGIKSPHVGWNSLDTIRRLRLLHPFVARAARPGHRLHHQLRRPLHRRRRAGQRDGRPVPP